MSAIIKTIAIHGDYLGNLMKYGANPEKTGLLNNGLENLLAYAENPDKTTVYLKPGEKSVLVDGVLCNPATADLDFKIFRDRYRAMNGTEIMPEFDMTDPHSKKRKHVKKAPVTAIHIIQSFSETEIDPRLVHQIGIEMLEKLGVQGVCDTHVNKEHVHNHIIINAYLPDGRTKFCLDKDKILSLRALSNDILHEHGLEIGFDSPRRQLYKSKQHQRDREPRDTEGREERPRVPTPPPTPAPPTPESPQARANDSSGTPSPIDTSRFSWDGRRRGNLEMLLRQTIALMQRMMYFMREDPDAQKMQPHRELKLSFLENALATVQREDLHSYADLKAALNDAGIKLNKAKSQIMLMESEEGLKNQLVLAIGRYEAAKTIYDSVNAWDSPHDLHLNTYPKEVASRNRAGYAPVTPGQKHDLITLLKKNKDWRIDAIEKGFKNLSAIDADRIIQFLSGKCSEKPDILIPSSVYWDKYAAHIRGTGSPTRGTGSLQPTEGRPKGPVSPSLSSSSGIRRIVIPDIDPVPLRDAFLRNISNETPAKREILLSLRNAVEQLASLGYSPEDIPALKEKLSRFEAEKEAAETDRQTYSKRYRDLLQLKQAVTYAEHEFGPINQEQNMEPPKRALPEEFLHACPQAARQK